MEATKEQIKRIHVHLHKDVIKNTEAKKAFVYLFTKDKKRTSTKQLTFKQANDALVSLGAKPFTRAFKRLDRWQKFDYKKKSHMNVLSLLMQLQWTFYSETSKRYFADTQALGTWLQGKAPVNKSLLDMSPNEVSKTIVALENMVNDKTQKNAI